MAQPRTSFASEAPRAAREFAQFQVVRRAFLRLPKGDGRPVLVLPGFLGSDGSTLVGLVVNGASYGDEAPTPNTQVNLPGVGYVVLNEQIPTGDGVHSTGLTVNMIHVYLIGPLGTPTGDIVVGTAQSAASL